MGLKILWRTELHRMGGHHRQRHARSQFDAGRHMRLVIRAPGTLQFQIKTMWKKLRELQGQFTGPCFVALQQGLSDRPGLGTGQHNQAFLAFAQPGQPHHGRPRACVLGPGSGQQLTHIQVALLVLHQQDHAGWCSCVFAQTLQPDLRTQQRFDTTLARLFVKLDSTKQIAQIGDGQGRLLLLAGNAQHIFNPAGAVNHRELSMQTKVNKHGRYCAARPGPS